MVTHLKHWTHYYSKSESPVSVQHEDQPLPSPDPVSCPGFWMPTLPATFRVYLYWQHTTSWFAKQVFKDLTERLGFQMVLTKQYTDELSVNESEKRITFPVKNSCAWGLGEERTAGKCQVFESTLKPLVKPKMRPGPLIFVLYEFCNWKSFPTFQISHKSNLVSARDENCFHSFSSSLGFHGIPFRALLVASRNS